MANYANLLATIAANIYTNGNNEVTAAMVKAATDAMVASLGAGYQFMGVATPTTNPGTPDQKEFYLASQSGVYTNFDGHILTGGIVIFYYASSWSHTIINLLDVTGKTLQRQSNTYRCDSGKTYVFRNTGSVGFSVTYHNSTTNTNEQFGVGVGEQVLFTAPCDINSFYVSNISGVAGMVWESTTIGGKMAILERWVEQTSKVIDTHTNISVGGTNVACDLVAGKKYIAFNNGANTVNAFYSIDGTDTHTLMTGLVVGEARTFIAPENSSYISISSVSGRSIVIYSLDSLAGFDVSINKGPYFIRVATFNTGVYNSKNYTPGSTDEIMAWRKLLGESGCALIGTQEDRGNYYDLSIKDTFWKMFKFYYREGTDYNYQAFASQVSITNVKKVYYTNTESFTFNHDHFLDGEFFANGKKVKICSFHFDWQSSATRAEQVAQVIAYYASEKYVIMMGDTNCDNYATEWQTFTSAGYTMANDGYFGPFNTVGYDESAQAPMDNIFIRGNIIIRNADIIVKDWTNDHCLLFADLAILG